MWNRLFGGTTTGASEDVSGAGKRVSFSESVPTSPAHSPSHGDVPFDLRLSTASEGSASSGRVSVKNTFIEVEPDDDDDDQPTMSRRSITEPPGFSKRVSFSAEDEQEVFDPEKTSPTPVGQQCPTSGDVNVTTPHLAEDPESSVSVPSVSSVSSSNISSFGPNMSVKNTFVHYDDCDEEEQPDMERRSMSGPVNLSVPSTEPVFIPLQAGQDQASREASGASGQAALSSNAQSVGQEPPAAMPGAALHRALSNDEDESQRHLRVKNTFIHYEEDDEDQPEAKRCASTPVSGGLPAKVYVPEDGAGSENTQKTEVGSVLQSSLITASTNHSNISTASVKNTFIHLENDDGEDEQPVMQRRCLSGPVKATTAEEPAFIPMNRGQANEPPVGAGQFDCDATPGPVGQEASLSPMNLWLGLRQDQAFESSSAQEAAAPAFSGVPFGGVLRPPAAAAPGFPETIEPPPGITKASSPDPGVAWPGIMAPGTGFHPVAGGPGYPASGRPPPPPTAPPVAPPVLPSLPLEAIPQAEADDVLQSPISSWLGVPSGKEDEQLASLGAAGHAAGTCRPCAHNWKPAGCSNGRNCNFCHACDETAFKKCKKDKISKLRDEGVPRRRAEKKQETQLGKTIEASQPAVATSDAKAAGPQSDREKAVVDPYGYFSGKSNGLPAASEPVLIAPQPEQPQLTLNEMTVNYDGPRACVRWMVDLKGFRESSRARVVSRKFTVNLQGSDVPFLLMLNPNDSNSKEATRGATARKGRAEATMQVKCVEAEKLPAGCISVAFAVGNLPPRIRRDHDFSKKTVCELSHTEAVWDITAAAAEPGATRCLISVELLPTP